jgi:hypothetical protein
VIDGNDFIFACNLNEIALCADDRRCQCKPML